MHYPTSFVPMESRSLSPRAGHQSAVEPLLFDSSFADLSRTSDSGNVEGDTAQK